MCNSAEHHRHAQALGSGDRQALRHLYARRRCWAIVEVTDALLAIGAKGGEQEAVGADYVLRQLRRDCTAGTGTWWIIDNNVLVCKADCKLVTNLQELVDSREWP